LINMETTLKRSYPNALGYNRSDYLGLPTTLCKGCGHNSIANMIVSACYELELQPEKIVKFSGIG